MIIKYIIFIELFQIPQQFTLSRMEPFENCNGMPWNVFCNRVHFFKQIQWQLFLIFIVFNR